MSSQIYFEVLKSCVNDLDVLEKHSRIQQVMESKNSGSSSLNRSLPSQDSMLGCSEPERRNTIPGTVDRVSRSSSSLSDNTASFMSANRPAQLVLVPNDGTTESSGLSSHQLELVKETMSVWYLPNIERDRATMLLSQADEGNFIVRPSSSRDDSLALTLRGVTACYHFSILFQTSGLSVSTSFHTFSNLCELIVFYSKPGTDMDHVLKLPEILCHCDQDTLKYYTSLKQEFWMKYPNLKEAAKMATSPQPVNEYFVYDGGQRDSVPPSTSRQQNRVSQMYDCLWRQYQDPPHSIDSVQANIRMIETLGRGVGGDVTPGMKRPGHIPLKPATDNSNLPTPLPVTASPAKSDGEVSFYDNYPPKTDMRTNTPGAIKSSAETIYCQPWDQNISLRQAMNGLRQVHESMEVKLQERNRSQSTSVVVDDSRDIMPSFAATRHMASLTNEQLLGQEISNMVIDMATDESCMFSKKINYFIKCTLESRKSDPIYVMKNVRQFLNGLRNFLMSSEKQKLQEAVSKERPKLRAGGFLNVEAIIECTLSRLLVRPLKDYIYRLIYDEYERKSNMRVFTKALDKAALMHPSELGVRACIQVPNDEQLKEIKSMFEMMVAASLPIKKMEYLLKAVEKVYLYMNNTEHPMEPGSKSHIGADDFLPVFVYCVARCRLYAAELEAEFMLGLIMPTILNGESGYYLTTLQASAEVIKSLEANDPYYSDSFYSPEIGPFSSQRGVVRVFILDEVNDSVIPKTFPLRPWSTVRELCNMIVHRVNVYNSANYSLYHYDDGEEHSLLESDHPMQIKNSYELSQKKPCVFIFKKTHSYIVMPEGFDSHVN